MTYFRYILLSIVLCLSLQAKAMAIDTLMETANYSKSVEVLTDELKGGANATTYYNLALSQYKLGNKAEAILAIERSFYLDPCNSDTRAVMVKLYKGTEGGHRYERGFVMTLADNCAYMLTMTSWIIWALLLFILSMACLVYYFYTHNTLHQRLAFYTFLILLALSLLANGAIAHQYYYHREVEHLAIVKEKTSVYTEPNNNGEIFAEVFAGNRLEVLDNEEGVPSSWQYVSLPNDQKVYIKKSAISDVIESIN